MYRICQSCKNIVRFDLPFYNMRFYQRVYLATLPVNRGIYYLVLNVVPNTVGVKELAFVVCMYVNVW